MKITKAIIPVAGWGTRMLPITKSIEKCMLPIGNRPVIDFVVQDCLKAGIDELIFVVGENSTQIESYYRSNIKLNDYLKQRGKEDKLKMVAPLQDVKLHFVVQPGLGKYGTAVPVALASDLINPGESVVVLMGDDFFYNPDGSSEVERLINGTPEGENGILGAVLTDDAPESMRYGSIEADERGKVTRLVEFPEVQPDIFVKNVSKYVFTHSMLQTIKAYVATDAPLLKGEYGVIDQFESVIASGEEKMTLVHAEGRYLDCGTIDGWLAANNTVLGNHYERI